MDTLSARISFEDAYGPLRLLNNQVRETPRPLEEEALQALWYDQPFPQEGLKTDQGQSIKIISPGWWNRQPGPDFRDAQIVFNETLRSGDVEIHRDHPSWTQHGHHLDERYNNVILIAVFTTEPPAHPPRTLTGRVIPCLLLGPYMNPELAALANDLVYIDSENDEPLAAMPETIPSASSGCHGIAWGGGNARLISLIQLAGDWRMLNKARILRERMDRAGSNQALYEAFMTACGYSHFKHHFQIIARQLPYERVRQIARRDPQQLEAALLHLAGLLPETLPQGDLTAPHFGRLRGLRNDHFPTLRSLPLTWRCPGVRPINYPERRLAGAARFLGRTADPGLAETLDAIWQAPIGPIDRRTALEALFPDPMGFWSIHCTWTGKKLARPTALIGPARVRSIIGNVFIPAALADARANRDRNREEAIFTFYAHLPREQENHIVARMTQRIWDERPPKLGFREQQGLLQLYYDWCQPNPSCRACPIHQYLTR